MAFGNATKGYVRSHAGGGGGGGTTDYEQLLNKPSINGVELLGDKSIGSLSGNIQVKLSDIANTNLNNVQNAQTLLYNALSRKWENGDVSSKIDYINYTGDGTSSRLFDVGTFKAIRIFAENPSTHASTNFIGNGDSKYYTTWIDGENIRTAVGAIIHNGTNIGLSGVNAGVEYNLNGDPYVIQIFR